MPTVNWKVYVLQRTLKLLAVVVPLLFGPVPTAQTQNGGTTTPLPKFAVASIRPINFEPEHHTIVRVGFTPDGLLDEGVPLILILEGTSLARCSLGQAGEPELDFGMGILEVEPGPNPAAGDDVRCRSYWCMFGIQSAAGRGRVPGEQMADGNYGRPPTKAAPG